MIKPCIKTNLTIQVRKTFLKIQVGHIPSRLEFSELRDKLFLRIGDPEVDDSRLRRLQGTNNLIGPAYENNRKDVNRAVHAQNVCFY